MELYIISMWCNFRVKISFETHPFSLLEAQLISELNPKNISEEIIDDTTIWAALLYRTGRIWLLFGKTSQVTLFLY